MQSAEVKFWCPYYMDIFIVNTWKDKFEFHGDRILYVKSKTAALLFHGLVKVFNLDFTEQMYEISSDLLDRNNLKYHTI